jgi:regulation of enolase protein 1 (concanavalin A-like superfamily)
MVKSGEQRPGHLFAEFAGDQNHRFPRRDRNLLLAWYSQDDGKMWKDFEEANIGFLPKNVEVGVSMTSNTKPGCTVKFRDFNIETATK